MPLKILVTGSTGFIGRVVSRVLAGRGHSLRLLVRPSPRLPPMPVPRAEVVVASFEDEGGLRAAAAGIDAIVHLASAEGEHRRRDLFAVDVEGTRNLLASAKAAGVKRILYLSHLGADRSSAYPFLQAKGIAENALMNSGIPALILRSSLVFGAGDSFTNAVALFAHLLPAVFFIPEMDTYLQPLWVEDLAACMEYCLAEDRYIGEILSIGGPEHLSFQQIVETVLDAIRAPRMIVPLWPPLARSGLWLMDWGLPHSPFTPFWMDYLAVPSTCEANSLSRLFGLKAAALRESIGYLRQGRGIRKFLQYVMRGSEALQGD
ncbi:MAG: NAD(P)H-binding protein [Anaerolineales bacterium]|nr:NAD(P)H-binding protein [Anaerolineales bacterium]